MRSAASSAPSSSEALCSDPAEPDQPSGRGHLGPGGARKAPRPGRISACAWRNSRSARCPGSSGLPYRRSPAIGCPIHDRCTRSWCVRPVFGMSSRRDRPPRWASPTMRQVAIACVGTAVFFSAVQVSPWVKDLYARVTALLSVWSDAPYATVTMDPTDIVAVPAVLVAWWQARRSLRQLPPGRQTISHRRRRSAGATSPKPLGRRGRPDHAKCRYAREYKCLVVSVSPSVTTQPIQRQRPSSIGHDGAPPAKCRPDQGDREEPQHLGLGRLGEGRERAHCRGGCGGVCSEGTASKM